MHVGILIPELRGHLNPTACLARHLVARGHTVSLFGSEKLRPWADSAGAGLIRLAGLEETEAGFQQLGRLSGLSAMKFTGALMQQVARVTRQQLPAAMGDAGVDVLLVDQFSPAGAVVAEECGLSYVVLCNALACYVTDSVPPAALGWRHRRGWLARLRNRLGNGLALALFDRFAGARQPGGVSTALLGEDSTRHGLAHVAQQPAWFALPGERMPAHFHATGPWHGARRDDHLDFPWHRLDGRPLVYASMGTLQNKLGHVYAAIAEAARGLDAQVVIALGGYAPWRLGIPIPENVIVVPYAPQLPLLDRAALAITHAGMNTVLECLARGVPMVTLPVTNDQPGVARRAERLGVSEFLRVGCVTPGRLRGLIGRVLGEPSYRLAAKGCQARIGRVDGAAAAADVIERAVTAGRPVVSGERERFASGGSVLFNRDFRRGWGNGQPAAR